MNEPVFTDDDTPMLFNMTFQEHCGGEVHMLIDIKPMLRVVWHELTGMPDYSDDQIKEGAANLGLDEDVWRDKWPVHRENFQKRALVETAKVLKDTVPETLADVFKALLTTCRYKAIVETSKLKEFRFVIKAGMAHRTSKVANDEWNEARDKLNERLGKKLILMDFGSKWKPHGTQWKSRLLISRISRSKHSQKSLILASQPYKGL